VLLGAFVGLRLAETCGLRPEDVDFMRAVVHPQVQYLAEPLKTKTSRTSVPIPASLAGELSAQIVNLWPSWNPADWQGWAPALALGDRAGNANSPQER
jgi:integrase